MSLIVKVLSRKGPVATGVRKNPGLVTLIGALILFCTFIIKDNFQESAASAISALRTAQTIFYHRMDSLRPMDSLQSLQEDTLRITEQLNVIASKEPTPHTIPFAFGFAGAVIDEDLWLGLIKDLHGSAFGDKEDNISKAINTLSSINGELQNEVKNLETLYAASKPEEHYTKYREHLKILHDSLDQLKNATMKVQLTMIIQLEVQVERATRRYDIFKWMSYFLYVFGWSLALAKELYGEAKPAE